MTDLKALANEIESRGIKNSFLANKIGISLQAFLNKMNGKTEFTASEISVLYHQIPLTKDKAVQIFLN